MTIHGDQIDNENAKQIMEMPLEVLNNGMLTWDLCWWEIPLTARSGRREAVTNLSKSKGYKGLDLVTRAHRERPGQVGCEAGRDTGHKTSKLISQKLSLQTWLPQPAPRDVRSFCQPRANLQRRPMPAHRLITTETGDIY